MNSDFFMENRKRLIEKIPEESIVLLHSGHLRYKTGMKATLLPLTGIFII